MNNNALPYSAFAKSLAELAKYILASKNASEIKADIETTLGNDDMQLISRAMIGCQALLGTQSKHLPEDKGQVILLGEGKEAVLRMQYALRRLMKAICSHLPVVMFIDGESRTPCPTQLCDRSHLLAAVFTERSPVGRRCLVRSTSIAPDRR